MAATETPPMMKCGHAANADHVVEGGKTEPACAICSCFELEDSPPDLSGRVARCHYCRRERPSTDRLAFFKHDPDREHDDFYCGCRGWD